MSTVEESHLRLEVGHILFLDIIGYSKLLADEQKQLIQELNQVVRQTKQFRVAEAEGKLTRLPTGDGMVLVFRNNPEAPVECALEISKALQSHPKLRVRMGIHSGPVNPFADVNDQSNLAGAGINVAQRVMNCGDGGHILLSKHFAEDLEHYARWRSYLHDVGVATGKHGLKVPLVNFYTDQLGNSALPNTLRRARNVFRVKAVIIATLMLVALLALGFWARREQREKFVNVMAAIPAKSVAVLPFENRTSGPDTAYFADGIQDEILTRLSKIADLKVISRTSSLQYQTKPANLHDVAKQLGVANILEGSVQRVGDQVRVNVQLLNAQTDSDLWADSYDRKVTDILGVESEIAKAIAKSLQAKLTGREERALAIKPTNNPEAYDAYLRGLAYTLKAADTPAIALGAQKYLKEAVKLDPKFALAWARLSYTDSVGYRTTNLQPTIALRDEARQAAETAVAIQPTLGEALHAMGYYHYSCLRDYDIAVRYFDEARQFLPNSSQIPESLAYVARRRGELDRSQTYFEEAERLDPRNVNILTQHALLYIDQRRFMEAQRKLDEVLNITPDDVDTLATKAAIAQAEGDLARAATILAPLRPSADLNQALETQIYQAILERRPSQIIIRLKEVLARPDPALAAINGKLRFWLGWAQHLAGEHAEALETWNKARSELDFLLKQQPEDYFSIGTAALTAAYSGDKSGAIALAEQLTAKVSTDKDAVLAAVPIEFLARVAAQSGEVDQALNALRTLLSMPGEGALAENVPLTPALLRLDPMFDPLRNDPRFQKLCDEKQP